MAGGVVLAWKDNVLRGSGGVSPDNYYAEELKVVKAVVKGQDFSVTPESLILTFELLREGVEEFPEMEQAPGPRSRNWLLISQSSRRVSCLLRTACYWT